MIFEEGEGRRSGIRLPSLKWRNLGIGVGVKREVGRSTISIRAYFLHTLSKHSDKLGWGTATSFLFINRSLTLWEKALLSVSGLVKSVIIFAHSRTRVWKLNLLLRMEYFLNFKYKKSGRTW